MVVARSVVLSLSALALIGSAAAVAGPPPPPGGHIPIYYGGANQGGYPPGTTGLADPAMQSVQALDQVWSAPNPFRGATAIHFSLAAGQTAEVHVFDLVGREVRALAHRAGENGVQSVEWNGRDHEDKPLAAGVYFYRVSAGAGSVTKKLVLLD